MMRAPLALVVLLAALAAACGEKKEPAPTPPPTPAVDTAEPAPAPADTAATPEPAATPDATAAAPAEVADTHVAAPAEEAPRAWIAWRQNDEGGLVSGLVVQAAGEAEAKVVGQRQDALVVAAGGKIWALQPVESAVKVAPCDEEGEATFVDLRYGPAGEPDAGQTVVLADVKNRPAAGANAIHVERLYLSASVGPLVVLHHWTNSDICPVPAGGMTYDVRKVLDLRDGSLQAPLALLDPAELAAAKVKAIPTAVKAVLEEYSDAPADAVEKVLTIDGLLLAWSDGGALEARYAVFGESPLFGELVDEPGVAGDFVKAEALPARVAALAEAAPEGVVAFWRAGNAEGRGYSVVPTELLAAAQAYFAPR